MLRCAGVVLCAVASAREYVVISNERVTVNGVNQVGRVNVQWGNAGEERLRGVSLLCGIDDEFAYFTEDGRADFLRVWTYSDENDLGPQTKLAEPNSANAAVPSGQFRSLEHQLMFGESTPLNHETCVVCRLQTSETGDVLGEATTTLVLTRSSVPEDPTLVGECPWMDDGGVVGDPHVQVQGGGVVDIVLVPGVWQPLLSSTTFSLSGRVFGHETQVDAQWFDGLALVDHATLRTIFNVTVRVATTAHIPYLRATLDDVELLETDSTYRSADGRVSVRAAKLQSETVPGVKDDVLTLTTPEFTLVINNARENSRAFFRTRNQQLALTHLDLKVKSVPHPQDFAGPLAEIMFKNVLTSKSDAAIAITKKKPDDLADHN